MGKVENPSHALLCGQIAGCLMSHPQFTAQGTHFEIVMDDDNNYKAEIEVETKSGERYVLLVVPQLK